MFFSPMPRPKDASIVYPRFVLRFSGWRLPSSLIIPGKNLSAFPALADLLPSVESFVGIQIRENQTATKKKKERAPP